MDEKLKLSAEACYTDGRSALRKMWERATYRPVIGGNHFLARGVTRFSLLDRLLILLGRDVVTIVSCESDPVVSPDLAFDSVEIDVGTQPRRYR